MSDYKSSVVTYFKDKAEEYDLVDDQIYWVLSDVLLWEILQKNVLDKLPAEFSFFDAGGGTGRWTLRMLEGYPQSNGKIVDLSEDMLRQARKKVEHKQLTARVSIQQADLDTFEVGSGLKESCDLAFSFHNVLGFVKDPLQVIGKMAETVKPGGYVVSLVPNYYHNLFFNLSHNRLDLAEETFNQFKGKFTGDMPEMHMFTPGSLKEIYSKLELQVENVFGFPVAIYPGFQETQLRGQTERLQGLLENEDNYNRILDMERKLYANEEAASRGNQIIIIGKKR